jgi:two-component system, NarL family, nitrate/nitrite response regulator NarL
MSLSRPRSSCYGRRVSGGASPRIRIVLVDDHPVVVKGLQALFRAEDDLDVVAACRTGAEGLVAVREHRPDVVVLDIRMPDLDGFGMLRAMEGDDHAPRVILLTAEIDEHATLEAVRLGVHGIVLKDMPAHLLLECVRKVHAGEHWVEKRSVGRAMAGLVQREAALREVSSVLTSREIEVVRMLARGLRSSSIASELHISESTVKTHLHRIYEKLGVDGRVSLILLAREKGLA